MLSKQRLQVATLQVEVTYRLLIFSADAGRDNHDNRFGKTELSKKSGDH